MMTPRRFRALADSYGAGLHRWPAAERAAAQALLASSAPARAILAEAAALDAALAANAEPAPTEAALARLRAGVQARLDQHALPSLQPVRAGWGWPGWLSIAAGGGAIAAGLLIGLWGAPASASASASGDVLALLQPEPIHAPD